MFYIARAHGAFDCNLLLNHFHYLKSLLVWRIFSMLLDAKQLALSPNNLTSFGSLNLATIHDKTTYNRVLHVIWALLNYVYV